MPVEIKELVIRAVIAEGREADDDRATRPAAAAEDHETLVQECVREVLRVLKQGNER